MEPVKIDYTESDKIRDKIMDRGWGIRNYPDGTYQLYPLSTKEFEKHKKKRNNKTQMESMKKFIWALGLKVQKQLDRKKKKEARRLKDLERKNGKSDSTM